MSLEKAIFFGKEYRRPYRGSKKFDPSCRNHGDCPYCEGGRLYRNKRREPADLKEQLNSVSED